MVMRRVWLLLFVCFVLFAADGVDLQTVFEGSTVRLVGFGDFGYRGVDSGRFLVATAIQKRHKEQPFNVGLTVGDNFYPRGVDSVTDPTWKEIWEKDYSPLKIPFFATLGNHDYDGNETAQVEYTQKSPTWKMPGRYYTFKAGPIQFFALDTDEGTAKSYFWRSSKPWSKSQVDWLDQQLKAHANARWKIVYGHHPIYSDGEHGDTSRMLRQLLPILKAHKIDVYLAGHDHDLQYHVKDGIHFAIIGGGGKDTRAITKRRAEFAVARHGFLDLTATDKTMLLRIMSAGGEELFSKTIEK